MTAKEYLSQVWRVDRMVGAKLEQVKTLHSLAEKAAATISKTPRSPSPNIHRMEDIIVKIVDLETEINGDIERLVDLRRDIVTAIKGTVDTDHQVLLELRYLAFMSWGEIAREMRYSKSRIFEIHRDALDNIKIPAPTQKTVVKVLES